MRARWIVPVLAVSVVALTGAVITAPDAADSPLPQATDPDTTGAAVWAHLRQANYRENWALWPGTARLYKGNEPHGMLLTTYLNPAALRALRSGASVMPPGAIVVKENYMPDSTLAAVTVMYKVRGYNRDHNDWFFTKHLPDGQLDKMPNGMAMQGRLPGCQNCHGAQRQNDYLFTGKLGGR